MELEHLTLLPKAHEAAQPHKQAPKVESLKLKGALRGFRSSCPRCQAMRLHQLTLSSLELEAMRPMPIVSSTR